MYRILEGDVMEMLRTLPDESVQCCITSPPYWGLRDYQIAPSIWPAQELRNAGGDARITAGREAGATNCAHEWMTEEMPTEVGKGNWAQGTHGRGGNKQRKPSTGRGCPENSDSNVCGSVPWQGTMRNKRSVWTITTQPFPEAHFATFPEKLVTPCILAGTSDAGYCPQCGAPWKRVFNKELVPTVKAAHTFVVDDWDAEADAQDQGSNRQKDGHKPGWANRTETTGWQAGCECNTAGAKAQNLSEPSSARLKSCPDTKPNPYSLVLISCTVLDCFMGSGTCGVVALRYGRNFIGIELNAKYVEMARKRIENEAPLWNQ